MAHNPVTDEEREQIIALIRSGLKRNEVARRSGRGVGTITRIGQSIGWDWLSQCDERTQSTLSRAHEARSAYSAERRAQIAATFTERAERLLAEMEQEFVAFNFGGKDNSYAEHHFDRPPVDAQFTMIRAAREAMRTVLDIDRHDQQTSGEGKSMIERLVDGLAAVAEAA